MFGRLTLVLPCLIALSVCSSAYSAECEAAPDHGSFIGCQDELMARTRKEMEDEFKQLMKSATAFDAAVPLKVYEFAASSRAVQENWVKWMEGQCEIEGMITLGASAPSPGYEMCAKDLMRARSKALAAQRAQFDQGIRAFK